MSREAKCAPRRSTGIARAAAIAAGLAALTLTAGPRARSDNPTETAKSGREIPAAFKAALEARSASLGLRAGGAGVILARARGLKEFMGKSLEPPRKDEGAARSAALAAPGAAAGPGTVSSAPPRSANNVAIRYFPNVSEDEPTVAANPRNPGRIVAGSHFIGDTANRCVAHFSQDGGKTWNAIPIFMPHLTHQSQCSDPVLAYAPDGSRVYYAYIDIKSSFTFEPPVFTLKEDLDILVSFSDDDGRTWTGPIVALEGQEIQDSFNVDTGEETFVPGFEYDKPWIGTHVPAGNGDDDRGNGNWVFVTATRFEANFSDEVADECRIDFARSDSRGTTWEAPQTLDSSVGGCAIPIVVQGSRPNGGLRGDVLVAWYHSGTDGFRSGSFNIRTRYSADNGASFQPVVVAATDSFELPLFLGPAFSYHRWWGAMFPDVEIAPNGTGHIVYTHDPVRGSGTEDGNIRYVGAAGTPYSTWSAPVTVNDDNSGKAQGWATLEAGVENGKTVLYALWEDHRRSSRDNLEYDVFSAKRTGTGAWSANRRITDQKSRSDFIFLGDYFDITIVGGGGDDPSFVYGVWTDRRDEPTEFDFDDDVWGARVSGGDDADR
jgi:hypothetical protein